MDFTITIPHFLTLFAVGQALFLAAFMLQKRVATPATKFLSVLFLFFAIDIAHDFLFETEYMLRFPIFYGTGHITLFLFGPLIFFYTLAAVNQGFCWKQKYWIHFLPFLLMNVVNLDWLTRDVGEKTIELEAYYEFLKTAGPKTASGFCWKCWGIWGFNLVYLFFAVRLTISNDKAGHSFFRLREKIIVWGFAIFWVVRALKTNVEFLQQPIQFDRIDAILRPAYVYMVSFFTLVTPNFAAKKSGKTVPLLSAEQKKIYLADLNSLLKQEKIYRKVDITLHDLAKMLSLNAKYLSYLINNHFGLNFQDFINQHRVSDAKELLADETYDRFTIEAIGQEVGFSSKVTFYRAFKKFTGKTPSAYKKGIGGKAISA